MSTRLLLIVSLIVSVFAIWFYRSQGELESPVSFATSNIEYQATDILAIQTNDKGMAEYSLIADELTHYSDLNVDRLDEVILSWRPSDDRHIIINANKAEMRHEQQKVLMNDNVVFVSQGINPTKKANSAADETCQPSQGCQPAMRIMTQELIGDLSDNRVYSDKPIKVRQADNTFESAKFSADMENGDYEFDQVAVTFMPPERKDTPLF